MDHSHNNRTNEQIRIPDQYHSEQQANQTGPYVNNEHTYTLPSPGLPRQTQVKSGIGPVSQSLPPDTSREAKATKLIPEFLGGKWDGLRGKKTSHLTVGSLNVEGMGKCKKMQIASMCDSLDMDILATIEHHQGDTHFRGASYLNNNSMTVKGFYNTSTHRPAQKKGGISWHWIKTLNIELWEGATLPDSLQQYAVERCWMKVIC